MNDEAVALRAAFLESFIRTLISEVKPSPVSQNYNFFDDHEEATEKPREVMMPPPHSVAAPPSDLTTTAPLQPSEFSAREMDMPIAHPPPKPIVIPRPHAPPPQHTVPATGGISSLRSLLNDPSVTSIECKGANTPLLIHQRGQVRPTNIALNKEQIEGIIDEFSRNTHIPIVGGMLKAAFRDLLITAIVSEYSGSRFVIARKPKNFSPYGR